MEAGAGSVGSTQKMAKSSLPVPPASKATRRLHASSFYTLFLSSHGLCLQHFHLSCTLKPLAASETWLPLLRQAQLAIMQRLEAQLSELIRKHDYRYKDEKRGAEMTSWQRAAGLVSGEEGSIT